MLKDNQVIVCVYESILELSYHSNDVYNMIVTPRVFVSFFFGIFLHNA